MVRLYAIIDPLVLIFHPSIILKTNSFDIIQNMKLTIKNWVFEQTLNFYPYIFRTNDVVDFW